MEEIILPNESKTQRAVRLLDRFETKVSRFNPGILIRALSMFINTLGYYQEEDIGKYLNNDLICKKKI